MSIVSLPLMLIQSLLKDASDLFFVFDQAGNEYYNNAQQTHQPTLTHQTLYTLVNESAIPTDSWHVLLAYVRQHGSLSIQSQYPFHTTDLTDVQVTLSCYAEPELNQYAYDSNVHSSIRQEMEQPLPQTSGQASELEVSHTFDHATDNKFYLIVHITDHSVHTHYQKLQQDYQQLQQKFAQITKVNQQLTHNSKAKDDFLASMSHELRTPLNSILGLSEALLESVYGTLNLEQMQSIRHIEESGKHLLALISDILDISKIRAGGLKLTLAEVDVESVCSEVIQYFKPEMKRKQLAFSLSMEGNVYTLKADERWFKQMLMNLLSNAVKFTPKGRKIGLIIKGDMDQRSLRVSVWDHGIGIKESDHHKLFQYFHTFS